MPLAPGTPIVWQAMPLGYDRPTVACRGVVLRASDLQVYVRVTIPNGGFLFRWVSPRELTEAPVEES